MFPGDDDPVRISFGPIGPALKPKLEFVGCPIEPQEEAFATSIIRENEDAICHTASRYWFMAAVSGIGPAIWLGERAVDPHDVEFRRLIMDTAIVF
jgi:hypothetical protein